VAPFDFAQLVHRISDGICAYSARLERSGAVELQRPAGDIPHPPPDLDEPGHVGVVAPVDQRYDVPLDAVSVTLPPAQNVVGPPAVIVAVGLALTVTDVGALAALQPAAFVTVTL